MTTMKRAAVRCIAVAVMLLAVAGIAEAQQQAKKVPRIGFLGGASASFYAARTNAFRQGLNELGYTEGKNIDIEYRYAEGKFNRLPDLAAELVGLKVDVIVAAPTPSVLAAKKASATTPIVFASVVDPVASGLVASLARPGGNFTGLSLLTPELSGDRLELLIEALHKVSRVAVLRNPGNPSNAVFLEETQAVAGRLGIQLQPLEGRNPDEIEQAFEAATRERARAIVVFDDPVIYSYRTRVVALAAKRRLPAMYGYREFVDDGGLMSYGPNRPDLYRRTATYVDKILKGAKPADLPVEQPMKFELVINLKTAKQIGLTIPPNVLARADKVI